MDTILNLLYKRKTEFIICGDININYMDRSNNRKTLDNLLATYNLINTVDFLTRIMDKSVTMKDNIFIDASRIYNIQPHINRLPNHDAQLITIKNSLAPSKQIDPHHIRIINNNSIAKFQPQLSWEIWEDVFQKNYVNIKFNNFLTTYLRNYHSSLKKDKKKNFNITKNNG